MRSLDQRPVALTTVPLTNDRWPASRRCSAGTVPATAAGACGGTCHLRRSYAARVSRTARHSEIWAHQATLLACSSTHAVSQSAGAR